MSSKASRRRRAAGMVMPYGKMRPNVTNWVVGPSLVNSSGALASGSSWMLGATGITLTSGTPQTIQAVAIVAAPNTSTPTIGRMKVDEVKGSLYLSNPVAGRTTVAVAIYVADQLTTTPTWETRDPLNSSFAAEDDYFFLEAQAWDMPLSGTATAPATIAFHLRIANPLIIGSGQALHVTVSYVNANAGTIILTSAFRTRIGPVA